MDLVDHLLHFSMTAEFVCLVFIFLTTGTEEANDYLPETLLNGSIKVCGVQCSVTCNFTVTYVRSILSLSKMGIFHGSSVMGSGLTEVWLWQKFLKIL